MQISEIGLALLRDLEGTRAMLYADVAGYATIGVGHCLTPSERSSGKITIDGIPVRYAQGLTTAQIDALLRQDLAPVERVLFGVLHGNGIRLTPGQWDALCCWIFNVGTGAFLGSTLVKNLRTGALDAIPGQLRRWTMAAGQVLPGLARRREREIARWLAPLPQVHAS